LSTVKRSKAKKKTQKKKKSFLLGAKGKKTSQGGRTMSGQDGDVRNAGSARKKTTKRTWGSVCKEGVQPEPTLTTRQNRSRKRQPLENPHRQEPRVGNPVLKVGIERHPSPSFTTPEGKRNREKVLSPGRDFGV